MSKRQFKSQASSSRAASGAFGRLGEGIADIGFRAISGFGAAAPSTLSYIYEPPDLSTISRPNVVVAFKGLQKKDSTTKSKALEDLEACVAESANKDDGIEEPVLAAWINIYPRLSIDNARRVRQLAHILQGRISSACGKRIAKYMPQVVGPWLAALYDNDKLASRAAKESLKRVFPAEEKLNSIWRVYQASLFTFVVSTLMNETAQTLSDERITSPDDAKAKYARVIAAVILLMSRLFEELSEADIEKQKTLLNGILHDQKIWGFAVDQDSFVRRAVYRLAVIVLVNDPDLLDMNLLSANLLTSSLRISQAGSILEYTKALVQLTETIPELWTEYYKGSGEQAATSRLCQFIKRGSQGGLQEFWTQIAILSAYLPQKILLSQVNVASHEVAGGESIPTFSILKAIHEGLNRKDEPRSNVLVAWNTYLDVSSLLISSLTDQVQHDSVAKYSILPLVNQFVVQSASESQWAVSSYEMHGIYVKALELLLQSSAQIFEEGWQHLTEMVLEELQTSLPEQSKDYKKSHDLVSAKAMRWNDLQAAFLKLNDLELPKSLARASVVSELNITIKLLRERDGKPYSAATALNSSIKLLPWIMTSHPKTINNLTEFAQREIPRLLLSPSGPQLVTTLDLLKDIVDVHPILETGLNSLCGVSDSTIKHNVLQNIISSSLLAQAAKLDGLNQILKEALSKAIHGTDNSWNIIDAVLKNNRAPKILTDELLTTLLNGLSVDEEASGSLEGLEVIARSNRQLLRDFCRSPSGLSLRSKLPSLIESPYSDISHRASDLSKTLEMIATSEDDSMNNLRSMVDIIKQGLIVAGPDSVSVEFLVTQAEKLLDQPGEHDKSALAIDLLPEPAQWVEPIQQLLIYRPDPSMAVMSILGSATWLVQHRGGSTDGHRTLLRDSNGHFSATRIVFYALTIIKETDVLKLIDEEHRLVLIRSLAIFIPLLSHSLDIFASSPLWNEINADVEQPMLKLVVGMQDTLSSLINYDSFENFSAVERVQQQLLTDSLGTSPASYYSGCAYSRLTSQLVEMHGISGFFKPLDEYGSITEPTNVISAAAVLTSIPMSKSLLKLTNELIAILTSLDFQNQTQEGGIICRQDMTFSEISQQRLVFFVTHTTSHIQKEIPSKAVEVELLKSFSIVLPLIKEIYGSFWELLIKKMNQIWSFSKEILNDDIPIIHTGLRLFSTFSKLQQLEEANDDLKEIWAENQSHLVSSLLEVVKRLSGIPDYFNSPRKIVNDLLSRQIRANPQHLSCETVELYPILASESLVLQLAAFELLHKRILDAQAGVSLNKALEKDHIAKLPEELLSLILTAPGPPVNSVEEQLKNHVVSSLGSFILSWKLVFDHWTNSSYKVKVDYAATLKDDTYLSHLLNFATETLITARTKPVNASNWNIEAFNPDIAGVADGEVHAQLTHLYYLSLKHLPNYSRTWWRDTLSRQELISVETWTEKYISPLIIASELHAISDWATSQSTADQPLHIKVSFSTCEISASIPVDEQHMQIAIRLPPAYPLARATVESIHRVAVDEKKWLAWLMTAQAMINFSGSVPGVGEGGEGSALIDGLQGWRRNVTATLKGQTECAICYSVVGSDRQLPSKRCGTCRNMFHGSCLYRWFKSSNSSSCPLCRNAFHYG